VIWVLFIAVAVLVVGAFAALIVGWVGYDPLAPSSTTQRDPGLPTNFRAEDLADVHFDTALRGYRMDQVDEVLDRLGERIAHLEADQARPEPTS
jgi:DivIVA domain-containing protein